MPTVYLGMPLGNRQNDMEIWDNIVEKTESRLAKWQEQYFSLGDRHILINSKPDALITYVMPRFLLP